MKIHLEKNLLEKELSKIIRAVSSKTPLPILSHILLKTEKENILNIYATDLEIGIQTSLNIQVLKEGSFCIPAKIFTEIINQLEEEEIVIEKKENFVELRTNNKIYKINILSEEDFPKIPQPGDLPTLVIKQNQLKELLKECVFSASSEEETQAVLTGVLVYLKGQILTLISTDGRRLSKVENKLKEIFPKEEKFIVPSRSLFELIRILEDNKEEVKIYTNPYQVFFQIGKILFYSRMIEGQYPSYEKVIIKKNEVNISFNIKREEFLKSLKRISILACERENPNLVKFSIEKEKLVITSSTQDLGNAYEEIEIKNKKGDNLKISFNSKYIIELLNNLKEEEVEFNLKNEKSPGLIKPAGRDNFIYAVMPVEIKKRETEYSVKE